MDSEMTFLSVEGLDGAGTTSVVEYLGEECDVVTTSEPTDSFVGETVRKSMTDESVNELTDFYLFIGDRIDHIDRVIKPNDENGTVVSDRYIDSTRAYQPIALAETEYFDSQTEAKLFIEEAMAAWNYEPDMTIYIDVSVDTAIERSSGDEKYETREFLEKAKENYTAIVESEPERFTIIDGEQDLDVVKEEALSIIT